MRLQLAAHLLHAGIERIGQSVIDRRSHQRIPRAIRPFIGPLRDRSGRARGKAQGVLGGNGLATVAVSAAGGIDREARVAATDEQTIKRREKVAQLGSGPLLRQFPGA